MASEQPALLLDEAPIGLGTAEAAEGGVPFHELVRGIGASRLSHGPAHGIRTRLRARLPVRMAYGSATDGARLGSGWRTALQNLSYGDTASQRLSRCQKGAHPAGLDAYGDPPSQ